MTDTISGQTIVGFNPIVLRGKDGTSIANVLVNESGDLIVTLTDDTTKNVGSVVSPNIDGGDAAGSSFTFVDGGAA